MACPEIGTRHHVAHDLGGVPEDDLAIMATEAHAIRRLLDNNPRDMSREKTLALIRAAL